MRDAVTCGGCRHAFEPAPEQLGGLVKCPSCGRVVDVPGLHDPLWWLLRAGAVLVASALCVWFGWEEPWRGAAAGAIAVAALWLLSRAL